MLSRRPEISAHRSGSRERGHDPQSRIAWHGGGMGEWNGALAVPRSRRRPLGHRPEYAIANGPRVEKGQQLSSAREFHRGRAAPSGGSSAEPTMRLPLASTYNL